MALKGKRLEDVRPTVPLELVIKKDLVRVNLNVPEDMRTRWKMAALERGIPLAELVISAVEESLSK